MRRFVEYGRMALNRNSILPAIFMTLHKIWQGDFTINTSKHFLQKNHP